MVDIDFKLEGKFKFEVFAQDGSLNYFTEYTPNFITPSGLNYIKEFALADCFRFVSVGTGTGQNTVIGNGTTGLGAPVSGYQYIGGNPISCGRGNQYIEGACGYRVDRTGFSLFRGWRVPAETGVYFNRNYIFNEFMVTPGPSRVSGYRYGGLSGACSCNQQVYVDSSEIGPVREGIEAPDFFLNYPQICDADKAFARVLRRIPVNSGEFLIVHYSLFVTASTGITSFRFSSGRGISVYNGENTDGIYNWSGCSGRYSLVHYGFKPINNGNVLSAGAAIQINSSYDFRIGESFIPFFGIPFEPSCPLSRRVGYLTNDNVQFFANPLGAAMSDTGKYFPYSFSGEPFPSGVIYFLPNLISEYSDDSTINDNYTTYESIINARRSSSFLSRPYTGDFLTVSSFTAEEVISTEVSGSGVNLPNSGRNRSLSLVYKFDDENLTGIRVARAYVQSYRHSSTSANYYPFLDMVLSPQDTRGNFVKEPVPTANYTSGIRFYTFNMITGTGDFPPMSIDVGSPYADHFPGTFHQQLDSGNSNFKFWGLFYSDTPRVDGFRTSLVQFSGGNPDTPIDPTLLGAGVGAPTNNPRVYCYVTPIHNSGKISGLTWLGTGFPQEAVELTSYNVVQDFPTDGESGKVFWPRLDYFQATDVVFPNWLLTGNGPGKNCVFCTGRFQGGPIYLTKTLVEYTDGYWFLNLDTRFADYSSVTFLPNLLTTYAFPSGAILTGSTGGYSYIDWNNQLAMKFYLNWSSPCSTGVIGC